MSPCEKQWPLSSIIWNQWLNYNEFLPFDYLCPESYLIDNFFFSPVNIWETNMNHEAHRAVMNLTLQRRKKSTCALPQTQVFLTSLLSLDAQANLFNSAPCLSVILPWRHLFKMKILIAFNYASAFNVLFRQRLQDAINWTSHVTIFWKLSMVFCTKNIDENNCLLIETKLRKATKCYVFQFI